jgi:cold shock CspA family protein
MGKSQETFGKKEKEKKRLKKRKEKLERKEERKANSQKGAALEDMLMYVDENGQLVDTPPDPLKKKKINASNIEISVPKKEIDPDAGLPKKGKVEFFNDQKGYGFIKDLDTQEKFFVHIHGCNDVIAEGDKVTFDLEKGLKGMNAVNVTLVK